jgi:hypothetical protein
LNVSSCVAPNALRFALISATSRAADWSELLFERENVENIFDVLKRCAIVRTHHRIGEILAIVFEFGFEEGWNTRNDSELLTPLWRSDRVARFLLSSLRPYASVTGIWFKAARRDSYRVGGVFWLVGKVF